MLFQRLMNPAWLSAQLVCTPTLWLSPRGSRSSLHYDNYHNLLCVVAGRKGSPRNRGL